MWFLNGTQTVKEMHMSRNTVFHVIYLVMSNNVVPIWWVYLNEEAYDFLLPYLSFQSKQNVIFSISLFIWYTEQSNLK